MRHSPSSAVVVSGGRAQHLRFHVERCEYVSSEELLRLWVRVPIDLAGTAAPMLVLERDAVAQLHPPLISCTPRRSPGAADEWLWRGVFALSPELARDASTRFLLRFHGDVVSVLPRPREAARASYTQAGPPGPRGRAWPYAVRGGAVLSVLTCLLPGWSARALAAHAGATGGNRAEQAAAEAPAGEVSVAAEAPTASPTTSTATSNSTGRGAEISVAAAPGTPAPAPRTSTPAPPPPPQPRAPAIPQHDRPSARPSAPAERRTATLGSGKPAASSGATGARVPNDVAPPPALAAAEAGSLAGELAGTQGSLTTFDFYRIPLFLLPIYQAAAAEYRVPWQVLAAINEVETDYGTDLAVSSAGALGWMQFMPETWRQYGVDALGSGYADPDNPIDAIFAAARYLRAAGARADLRGAILAYNHSEEYAQSVLLRARLIAALPARPITALTDLADAVEPVEHMLSWSAPARGSSSDAAPARRTHRAAAPAPHGSLAPPPRIFAPSSQGLRARPEGAVELLTRRGAAVVAVREGRVLRIGRSRRLGRFIALRDPDGDVFTYAGLGRVASAYTRGPVAAGRVALRRSQPAAGPTASVTTGGRVRLLVHPGNVDALTAAPPATGPSRRHGAARISLRAGSLVPQGTVLGSVNVPRGARDGHLRFWVQPAGDPGTIDPVPLLRSWRLLGRAMHPTHASGLPLEAVLEAAFRRTAKSAHAARLARSWTRGAGLGVAEWDRVIERVSVVRSPRVARTPSTAEIPDA